MNIDTPTQSEQGQDESLEHLPTHAVAKDSRVDGGVRHRLTSEQRREIARLYSETGASVAELRQRYDVSEPSVYRILQTQGVALRGRATSAAKPVDGTVKRAPTARSRTQTPRGAARGRRSRTTAPAGTVSNGTTQFRIEYVAERVIRAADVRDALRQAESFGAGDIVRLTREN